MSKEVRLSPPPSPTVISIKPGEGITSIQDLMRYIDNHYPNPKKERESLIFVYITAYNDEVINSYKWEIENDSIRLEKVARHIGLLFDEYYVPQKVLQHFRLSLGEFADSKNLILWRGK